MFGKPAVVHFEPDFWAYAEQQSHEDPTTIKVALRANAPDCADLSDDLVGMGHCIVKLARMYAPQSVDRLSRLAMGQRRSRAPPPHS